MGKVKKSASIQGISNVNPLRNDRNNIAAHLSKSLTDGILSKKREELKPITIAPKKTVTIKPAPGVTKTISKKQKKILKQKKVLQNIELTQAAFKEDKARKKRQKTAIVGDLRPLLDSLTSLEETMTIRQISKKNGIPSIGRIGNAPKSKFHLAKFQKNQMIHEKTEKLLDRFDHVQKIWNNPEYQKNPRQLIADQIRKRCQQ